MSAGSSEEEPSDTSTEEETAGSKGTVVELTDPPRFCAVRFLIEGVSQRFVVCPDGEVPSFHKRLESFYGHGHREEFTIVRGVFSLGFVECFGEEAQDNPRALVMLLGTAPTPVSEASVSRTSSTCGLGCPNPTASASACLDLSKAAVAASVQMVGVRSFFLEPCRCLFSSLSVSAAWGSVEVDHAKKFSEPVDCWAR
ncbi:hypothetical protein AAG570_000723 [Ranatra chinensis]|uniref:Uncharacterized protein n=1 Tax=Ranatra chinensis TaxID=642074 RepID=A0ABD0YXX6_9HEMI